MDGFLTETNRSERVNSHGRAAYEFSSPYTVINT